MDNLFESLRPAFPELNKTEQEVSLQIYRLLCKGNPVTRQSLAERVKLPIETVHEMLNRWWGIEFDQQNRITGYWGLTIQSTRNCFKFAGQKLYTWCAWDALFLPQILQISALIESHCSTNHTEIRLTINPERVEQLQPENAVISFVTPEVARIKKNVLAHFCHFVRFFESEEAGLNWTSMHPGALLLTIDQAHRLGRKFTALRYPDI